MSEAKEKPAAAPAPAASHRTLSPQNVLSMNRSNLHSYSSFNLSTAMDMSRARPSVQSELQPPSSVPPTQYSYTPSSRTAEPVVQIPTSATSTTSLVPSEHTIKPPVS